jgi:hypothetical protein
MREHLVAICDRIRLGSFFNEATVKQGIVLGLLGDLGWDILDTDTVAPEYPLESRRVDYALCDRQRKPIIFIEVKQVGQVIGAERQLFEYAFHKGVPMVILTDGKEWNFFLPAEQGDYDERRVYKLDLLERDLDECISRLTRYLTYSAVLSKEALEAARADYRDATKDRQISLTLPRAWRRLIEDNDKELIDLLAEKVESLCGYKPETDVVATFLDGQLQYPKSSTEPHTDTAPRTFRAATAQPASSRPFVDERTRAIGFIYEGREYNEKSARGVMIEIMKLFARRDPSFLERFAAEEHGRERRYIARTKTDLYPRQPAAFAQKHSKELISGWWIGVNYDKGKIEGIIKLACQVADIRYGTDLQVYLGK